MAEVGSPRRPPAGRSGIPSPGSLKVRGNRCARWAGPLYSCGSAWSAQEAPAGIDEEPNSRPRVVASPQTVDGVLSVSDHVDYLVHASSTYGEGAQQIAL